MKSLNITQVIGIGSLLVAVGAGCNSGSPDKLYQTTNPITNPTTNPTTYPITNPTTNPISYPRNPLPGPTAIGPEPGPVGTYGFDQPVSGTLPGGTYDNADSVDTNTRDTDLQQADLQSANLADRAQSIANQFQMSVEAATQLAVLGDKVHVMTTQGQALSDEDRDAITQSALSIAGISSGEVTEAFQKSMAGDTSATDALLEKAAKNLGMPSSDNLKGQLLQSLGVELQ